MSYKIVIDPGHAPGNANRGPNGYFEYAGMWKLSNYLKPMLEQHGFSVNLTRTENQDPSLTARGRTVAGCDLFISQHSNAFNGSVRGVEVFYSLARPGDKMLAMAMAKAIAEHVVTPNRGAKTRESNNHKGQDHYTVILEAIRAGASHVLLVESGFHDNPLDEAFLLKDENLRALADTQAQVICEFFNVTDAHIGTPIIGPATATLNQAQDWAESKRATEVFIGLVGLYFLYAPLRGGVNPIVAYCQAAKETGYGRFGGVLDESFNNPCGLKTRQGGGCEDPSAHHRFESWDEGVKAHIDHLALYAGAEGYPLPGSPDPRHFPYLFGKCKTVESLSGNWAMTLTYGDHIVRMMNEVVNMPISEQPDETIIKSCAATVPDWQMVAFRKLVDLGVITSPEYWETRMSETVNDKDIEKPFAAPWIQF